MSDMEPIRLHGFDYCGRWSCASRGDFHCLRKRGLEFLRGIGEHIHHDGRAAHMSDAIVSYGCKDGAGLDCPEAYVGAHCGGDCPGKGPAVAVKHRQGPQVHRVTVKFHGGHVAQRIQVSAAVMIDTAFGVPGGTGGVQKR